MRVGVGLWGWLRILLDDCANVLSVAWFPAPILLSCREFEKSRVGWSGECNRSAGSGGSLRHSIGLSYAHFRREGTQFNSKAN